MSLTCFICIKKILCRFVLADSNQTCLYPPHVSAMGLLPETTMCSFEFVYLLWTVGLFNGFAHSIQVVSNLGLTVGTGHGMLESRKNRERTSKQHGLALDGIKHTKSSLPPHIDCGSLGCSKSTSSNKTSSYIFCNGSLYTCQ